MIGKYMRILLGLIGSLFLTVLSSSPAYDDLLMPIVGLVTGGRDISDNATALFGTYVVFGLWLLLMLWGIWTYLRFLSRLADQNSGSQKLIRVTRWFYAGLMLQSLFSVAMPLTEFNIYATLLLPLMLMLLLVTAIVSAAQSRNK
jgi:hypothetical protein